jgi:hypothetical protein
MWLRRMAAHEDERTTGSRMSSGPSIPAVWRIDVEPDQHQPRVGQGTWDGFVATVALVTDLRERLERRSGRVVHPTWLLRMDPDIERCFGHADFVVRRHAALFDQLAACNDPLGIHVHHYRWDVERGVAFSDHADSAWTTHCLAVAATTFENTFGSPALRASHGGYFLTEDLLDAAVQLGIEVDLTAEPGVPAKHSDPSLGAYATAPSTDFVACPRRPYFPSRRALGVPAPSRADSRPILIVPLTAYDYESALRPWYRQLARTLFKRPNVHLPLNPWKDWPSPQVYWDLVACAADEQPLSYFAFAMRTDAPSSRSYRRVRELLEHLPHHPICERLQFVDPLGPEIQALANW